MLKVKKNILIALVFGLAFLGFFALKRPCDPKDSFVKVSVFCRYDTFSAVRLAAQNVWRFLPAVCVDVKRRYFVMSNSFFMLTQCDSIMVWFSDGSSSCAKLVFNDEDAGLAVIQADTAPTQIKALEVGPVRPANGVDGYHFLFTPTGHSVVKKRTSLPIKTLYDFGLWETSGVSKDAIFVDAQENTLVGLHVLSNNGRDFFVKGEHIAYVLSLVQKSPNACMFKPKYLVRGTETHYLEQVGLYTKDVDRALSVDGDNVMAHEVFVVVQGDGVFEVGDIMKYRHVDQQGNTAYWSGPNSRKDTSDRVKVWRRGEILELRSQTYPVGISRYNDEDRVIFMQARQLLRFLSDWPKRETWFSVLIHPWALGGYSNVTFDHINGKTIETVEDLKAALRIDGPVLFSSEDSFTPHVGAFALPGKTACDVMRSPSTLEGGLK